MEHTTGKISPMGFIVSAIFTVLSWIPILSLDDWAKIGQIGASVIAGACGIMTMYFMIRNNRKRKREKQ